MEQFQLLASVVVYQLHYRILEQTVHKIKVVRQKIDRSYTVVSNEYIYKNLIVTSTKNQISSITHDQPYAVKTNYCSLRKKCHCINYKLQD